VSGDEEEVTWATAATVKLSYLRMCSPTGIHSRMPIASATKWVTAATVMLLVENGTLKP
jgi:CubicO group peptidase (beta-lactamase class C family)